MKIINITANIILTLQRQYSIINIKARVATEIVPLHMETLTFQTEATKIFQSFAKVKTCISQPLKMCCIVLSNF